MSDFYNSIYQILERSNRLCQTINRDDLIDQYLQLILEASRADGYILKWINNDLYEPRIYFDDDIVQDVNILLQLGEQMFTEVTRTKEVIRLKDEAISGLHGGCLQVTELDKIFDQAVSIPLSIEDELQGVLTLINPAPEDYSPVYFLCNRFLIDLRNNQNIQADRIRIERLECLVDIFGRISSTLDRDQILNLIIEYSYKILSAEAGSLFFVDDKTGESILYISSNLSELKNKEVRVPSGRGIIGTVIKTGETIIVNDVTQDVRHYNKVDLQSGKHTRSILAVPLIARTVVLGGKRGSTEQKIIGGIEAINKIDGNFIEEDAELLRTLANQAATVLEIAQLYLDANDLFLSSIKALTAAIDAKDSYTEGHSQRVSEISVEIARELGLSQKEIYQIQIGSLLHDVGKIGISDNVLKKPGKLTAEEYTEMKRHPAIGEKIMGKLHLLSSEILAVAEHHERPDGSGYPRGLKDGEISLFGRIVAVADVFDAMTSDRPYRKSLSVDEVFEHLWSGTGTQFDQTCVEALYKVFQRGGLPMQKFQDDLRDDIFKITLDTHS